MLEVNVYEAKVQLSKYLSMLINGNEEEIIVTKNGKPVAKLVPIKPPAKRRLGAGLLVCEAKPFVLDDPSDNLGELFGY